MNTKTSIIIERPIDEVFAYVSNVENMSRWVSGVDRVRLISDKVKSGATFTAEYAEGIRKAAIDFKVVEFEPPTRFATKSERGPFSFPFRGTLELRAVGDTTEVTNNVDQISHFFAHSSLTTSRRPARTSTAQESTENRSRTISADVASK